MLEIQIRRIDARPHQLIEDTLQIVGRHASGGEQTMFNSGKQRIHGDQPYKRDGQEMWADAGA